METFGNPEWGTDEQIRQRVDAMPLQSWRQLEKIYDLTTNQQVDFYKYVIGAKLPDQTPVPAHTETAPVVKLTKDFFYANQLVVPMFWASWQKGQEILQRPDENKFDDVSLEDTIRLFTAVIRFDREDQGALARLFQSGDAKKLLEHLLGFNPYQQNSLD